MQASEAHNEQHDDGATDHGWWFWIVAITLGLVVATAIIFLPLAVAGVEYFGLGTHHFEDWLKQIGVHEPLGRIYQPVTDSLRHPR